jgi:hypothetical protein
MNTSTTETPKPPELNIRKVLKKSATFFKNFVSLIAWTWLISRVLQKPFPFESYLYPLFQSLADPTVRLALQIALAASALSIVVFRWYKAVLKFLFFLWVRMVFFPVVAAFYLFYIPYKSFKFLFKGINAFLDSFVRTTITKAAILLVLLLPASVLIILNSQDALWLLGAIALTILALMITLRTAFYWTAKPLIIIEEILATYEKAVNWYIKWIIKGAEQSSKDPQKQYDSFKSQLGLFHKGLDWLQAFTERNTDHRVVVRVFFFLFGICFLLTVISFGVLYFTLSKLHPEAFANASNWELLDYIYSSLLVITTSGELTPLWGAAKSAVAGEIVCGVSLLTLLIIQFSMISIPEVLEKRKDVLRLLSNQRDDLNNLENSYANKLLPSSERGS